MHVQDPQVNQSKHDALFTINRYQYRLPAQLFNGNDPTKITTAYSFDIMECISEFLLNMDNPEDFSYKPDIRYSNIARCRIYEDYVTGDQFKNVYEKLTLNSSSCISVTSILGIETKCQKVPLMIAICCDETTNRSQKKSATPLYFCLLNCKDRSFKTIPLGFIPDDIHYTDGEIIARQDNKVGLKSITKICLDMYRRKQCSTYLYDVVSQLLHYQVNGVILRVGKFPSFYDNNAGFYIHAFPFLALTISDNVGQHNLLGCKMFCKFSRCRICNLKDCSSLKFKVGEFRDDASEELLRKKGEAAVLQKFLRDYSAQSSADINNCINECKLLNIGPGSNKMVEFYLQQRFSDLIGTFSKSTAPDSLHTVLKGLLEYCVTWVGHCIQLVGLIDEKYSNNMLVVDARIATFPRKQTLTIWSHDEGFRAGLSSLLKKKNATKANKGTGNFATGSIEAYKMPSLVCQLMFSLTDSSILPFDSNWCQKFTLAHNWNIGQMILNAMASTLTFFFMNRSKVMLESDITKYEASIVNMRYHLALLWKIRHDLVTRYRKESSSSGNTDKIYSGMKIHMSLHLPFYKRLLGADKRSFDTELMEHAHSFYKEGWELTQKQDASGKASLQILQKYRNSCHYRNLRNYQKKSNTLTPPHNDLSMSGYIISNTSSSPMEFSESFFEKRKLEDASIFYFNSYLVKSKLFNPEIMLVSLEKYASTNNSFNGYWNGLKNNLATLRSLSKLKFSHNINEEFENDFTISCGESIFSFVEANYTDENNLKKSCLAQVLLILNFKYVKDMDEDNDSAVSDEYLVIVWMQEIPNAQTYDQGFLPFPLHRYWERNKSLWVDVIPSRNVLRPAYVIPAFKRGKISKRSTNSYSHGWDFENYSSKENMWDRLFFSIPHSQVTRNTCPGYVDLSESEHQQTINAESDAFTFNCPYNLSSFDTRKLDDMLSEPLPDNLNVTDAEYDSEADSEDFDF